VKRLLDYDPLSGIETWHEYDPLAKTTKLHYVPTRDVDPTLDYLTDLANNPDISRSQIKQNWWLYAHVPDSLLMKWHCEEGVDINDTQAILRKVNSPDYKRLKATALTHE